MVSVSVFASVVAPLFIVVIILLVLVFGSRSTIGTLREDYKKLEKNQELNSSKIQELFDQSNSIGVWAWAAQDWIKVPQENIDEVYEQLYCPDKPGCSKSDDG